MVADLHIHSTYSDGSYLPEEIIIKAQNKGLNTIALTDHDTVAGIEDALKYGKKYGITVIPGIEFSTYEGKTEIHILGYYINHQNQQLIDKTRKLLKMRINRAKKMVKLLNEQGINITYEQVKTIAGDKYVGRPHIARALIEKGYIKEIGEAFSEKYIGNGGRAYVPRHKLTSRQTIAIIKKAHGIPVLAHPYFINHGEPLKKDYIARLIVMGLKGIEVFHSKHGVEVSKFYEKIARELGLIITGGSDFHGENSPGVELGDVVVEDDLVRELRKIW